MATSHQQPTVSALTESPDKTASLETLRVNLDELPYYHGLLGSHDCADVLAKTGDFLMRISLEGNVPAVTISVRTHKDGVYHARLLAAKEGTLYELVAGTRLPSPAALVEHYVTTKEKITVDKRTFQLVKVIARPAWHLSRTDVTLTTPLSDGSKFGNVSAGRLRVGSGHLPVAVKKTIINTKSTTPPADFMKDAQVLHKLEHVNVVRLLGVVVGKSPLCVMELCPGGSVLDRLHKPPLVSTMQKST